MMIKTYPTAFSFDCPNNDVKCCQAKMHIKLMGGQGSVFKLCKDCELEYEHI